MTSAIVLGIDQSLPSLSAGTSNTVPQGEKGASPLNSGTVTIKEDKPTPSDTISLSPQSRQATSDAAKEEAKKEQAHTVYSSGKSVRTMAKVQFVYDLKGNLSVRFTDTANRLIYQVPSEFMLRLKEAASKSDSSVDMKV